MYHRKNVFQALWALIWLLARRFPFLPELLGELLDGLLDGYE